MKISQPKWEEQKTQETLTSSPNDPPATVTNVPEALSWAKLRELTRLFNALTSVDMKLETGKEVFAGSQGMKEEDISHKWDNLSREERDKWEKQAAAKYDIERLVTCIFSHCCLSWPFVYSNRTLFLSSLSVLLTGCLQLGHIGQGEIVTIIAFDEGIGKDGRKISSHG